MLHLQLANTEMIVARRNPEDQQTTSDLYWAEGLKLEVPPIVEKNARVEDLKNRFNQISHLPTLDFSTGDLRNSCRTRRSGPSGGNSVAIVRLTNQSLQTRPMKRWKDKAEFKGRILHWAGKLGVHVRMVTVRPMRNKWASCSTAGNLHFNSELLSLDRKVGDYVIVHELLHFSVPNHGKLWKSLMRAHLGDFERIEGKLRKAAGSASAG